MKKTFLVVVLMLFVVSLLPLVHAEVMGIRCEETSTQVHGPGTNLPDQVCTITLTEVSDPEDSTTGYKDNSLRVDVSTSFVAGEEPEVAEWTFQELIVSEGINLWFTNGAALTAESADSAVDSRSGGREGTDGATSIPVDRTYRHGGDGGDGGSGQDLSFGCGGTYPGKGGAGGGAGGKLFFKGGSGGDGAGHVGVTYQSTGGTGGTAGYAGANVRINVEKLTVQSGAFISVSGYPSETSTGHDGGNGEDDAIGAGGGGGAGGSGAGRLSIYVTEIDAAGSAFLATGGDGGDGGQGGDDTCGHEKSAGGGGGGGGGADAGEILIISPQTVTVPDQKAGSPGEAGLSGQGWGSSGEAGLAGEDATTLSGVYEYQDGDDVNFALCQDEQDNDGDGFFDMADADCYNFV